MRSLTDLKLKKIVYGDQVFTPYLISDKPNNIPEYGVIFPNGLVVECEFGMHSYAYAIGSLLLISIDLEIDDIYGDSRNVEKSKSSKVLYDEIKNAVDKDGLISYEDSRHLFPIYRSITSVKTIKERYPKLYYHVGSATFINSKANSTDPSDIVKDWAKTWIRNNGKFIWAVRVFAYMRDEEWWSENTKAEWDDIFKERLGIKLKPIKYFTEAHVHTTFGERYNLPGLMIEAGGKYKKEIENVIDIFATVREMAGYEAWYGSFWLENFFSTDIDDEIFYYENLGPQEIRNEVKRLESLPAETQITIHDTYSGIELSISRGDITGFSYSKTENDEAYINFKAPKDLSLRKMFSKGEVVSNYSIDEYTKISIGEIPEPFA